MLSIRTSILHLLILTSCFSVMFSITMILLFTTYTDSWLAEVWWLNDGSFPSLYVSFTFATLLLGWLAFFLILSAKTLGPHLTAVEIVASAGSLLLVLAVGCVLWTAWDAVELENYHRYGNVPRDESLLENRIVQNDHPSGWQDARLMMQELIGTWEINLKAAQFSSEARYVVLWKDGSYQLLDLAYRPTDEGDVIVSPGPLNGGNFGWKHSTITLVSDATARNTSARSCLAHAAPRDSAY